MEGSEHDIRKLRGALEDSRSRQRLAKGGAITTGLCFAVANTLAPHKPAVATVLLWLAPLPLLGASIPFWLVRCPKCARRYHSLTSIFRSADNPAPCASCGFDIEAHIPRYGSPRLDT